MVAIKAHQARQFLKSPDARITAFLFYGSDAGLVSERATQLAKALANKSNPAGEVLRIDDSDLETESDRLDVELHTVSMFAGQKIVRVTAGRRINAAMLTTLVGDENLAGALIVEASNLKPADKLRKLFEGSATAAAVACFSDTAGDLDSVITEVLQKAKQTITPDARAALIARLGADRALSRGEVEKLSLYAAKRNEITVEDINAIVGDASETAFEKVVASAASGQAQDAVREYNRQVTSGESPQAIIAAAGRYFHRLHRVCAEIERGQPGESAIRLLRPPLHFKQRNVFLSQCRMWTAKRLLLAISLIAAAAHTARNSAHIEALITERLLMNLSRLAKA